jgi:hypothetical protein
VNVSDGNRLARFSMAIHHSAKFAFAMFSEVDSSSWEIHHEFIGVG